MFSIWKSNRLGKFKSFLVGVFIALKILECWHVAQWKKESFRLLVLIVLGLELKKKEESWNSLIVHL